MDFFRRTEKRPTEFEFARVLIPLSGEPIVDDPALKIELIATPVALKPFCLPLRPIKK